MPSEAAEHAETYLRTVFGFIGIANPEIIVAEGIQIGPEQREKALAPPRGVSLCILREPG